jgi:Uma2 family endonuclease
MATTTTAPMTLEEFERLPDDGNRYEVSEGELIVMTAPKSLHNRIVRKIFKAIEAFLDKSALGESYAESAQILSRNPLTIRIPDVAFLSNERIRTTEEDEYFAGAPELAIEVVSPSQSANYMGTKVEQYLRFGAKQVWIVYPKRKCIHVYRADKSMAILDESETLTGGDLLPGFSVKVSDLFV